MRKGTGEYPAGWPEFAVKLKTEAGWRCIRCNHKHDPKAGYCLTVHHLTMNKSEPFENWWAFCVLCQRCHLKIQGKVVMERVWILPHSTWFKPYVAGYYAHQYGYDESREYVMEHLDELIARGQNL